MKLILKHDRSLLIEKGEGLYTRTLREEVENRNSNAVSWRRTLLMPMDSNPQFIRKINEWLKENKGAILLGTDNLGYFHYGEMLYRQRDCAIERVQTRNISNVSRTKSLEEEFRKTIAPTLEGFFEDWKEEIGPPKDVCGIPSNKDFEDPL